MHRIFLIAALGACHGTGSVTGDAAPEPDAGGPVTEVAPYFYTWGWGDGSYAFATLADMKAIGGPSAVTIAFVLAGNGCEATTDVHDHQDDVDAYLAAGGHVKASFGGAAGTYLEYQCASADELAGAIERFVDATGVTDLDFDLEQGGASSNPALNQLRATALAQVQAARGVRVAFTLPVAPDGLRQESLDILQAALDAGVAISFVNGMTMDYGDGTDLGTVPAQSCDALAAQLETLMPSLTSAQAYRMIGATAMIGQNDDAEIFSIDDAHTLAGYASQHQLGLLSFWAIQRDQPCSSDLDHCSLVNDSLFQFADAFAAR